MSWVLPSLFRRAISLLLVEVFEHLVVPVLAVAVGRLLTA